MRAKEFVFRGRSLAFSPGFPLLMGIVNTTPDSFSDGGEFLSAEAATVHAMQLLREGAAILDIGGESTRPGATPVPASVELARVVPVVESLRKMTDAPISVDTSKASVARAALLAGADIVNDVTACGDPGMCAVLAEFQAGCVLMDNRRLAEDCSDPAAEIRRYLLERRENVMIATGLSKEHFLLDPGVCFGKTLEQNLAAIRRASACGDDASGVLLGVSRKSFIGKLSGETVPSRRLPGTLAVALMQREVEVLRVHDVAAHRQALLVAEGISEDK